MPVAKYLYQTIAWRGSVYFASFILNICIARIYGPEGSGSFFYNISIYSLFVLIVSLSLDSGLGFYASKNKINANQLYSFSLLWVGCVSLCLLTIFYLITNQHEEYKEWLYDGLPFIAGNILMSYLTTLLYAKKHFIIPNLLMLLAGIILILLMPGFVFNFISPHFYLHLYQWSFLVIALVLALIFYITDVSTTKWQWPSVQSIKIIVRYSGLAWVGNMVFFFLYRVDYWFVQHYCTDSNLGNYIQVSRLAQIFFLIPSIIASVIFPLTASGGKDDLLKMIALISRIFLWLYMVICFMFLIGGHWLFPFIFGVGFTNMYMPFIFIIPGILSLAMLYPVTAFNAGMNKLKINLYACIISLCIMVSGDYFFIPCYGIHAAAIVSSISYMVLAYILFYYLKKNEKISLKPFFVLQKNDLYLFKSYFTNSTSKKSGIQQ